MELNIKLVLQELAIELTQASNIESCLQDREVYTLACLTNRCKAARAIPQVDFTLKPVLENNWNHWNSGDGYMIWSLDMKQHDKKIGSFHVTEEVICASSVDTAVYWDLGQEEREATELLLLFTDTHPDLFRRFIAYFGSHDSASVIRDINSIHNFI